MTIAVIVSRPELVECASASARGLAKVLNTDAEVLTAADLVVDCKKPAFSFYLCVTNGTGLDLFDDKYRNLPYNKLAVWFISAKSTSEDVAHNFYFNLKSVSKMLSWYGSWSFAAQYADFISLLPESHRVSWLPLCADTELYQVIPVPKTYDVCIVQSTRSDALVAKLHKEFEQAGVSTTILPYMSRPDITQVNYSMSHVSLHVVSPSSMYGENDTTLNVFASLACGVPAVTNASDNLPRMFYAPTYLQTYTKLSDIVEVTLAFKNKQTEASATAACLRMSKDVNYTFRMQQAVTALSYNGVLTV